MTFHLGDPVSGIEMKADASSVRHEFALDREGVLHKIV